MNKRRIRVTEKEIIRARETLLSPSTKRTSSQEQKPKWGKDLWHGLIYCDSYGSAWIADTNAPNGNHLLGKTEEVLGVIKHEKIDKDSPIDIIRAMERYWSEKKSPSCHSASGNHRINGLVQVHKSNRATFRENPALQKILYTLIKDDYGLPTIHNKIRNKGYKVPYRTLGRWIKKIKDKKLYLHPVYNLYLP